MPYKFKTQITFALLFVLSGCNNNNQINPGTKEVVEFHTIQLQDLSGTIITPDIYRGKTIFINFWATWCKPCLKEMPSIEKAQNILHKEDVVFLMASSESTEEINAFRNAHNYKFIYTRIKNSEELDIQGLPTTFIFNAEGKLVFSEMGYRKWDGKNNIDMLIKIANKDD